MHSGLASTALPEPARQRRGGGRPQAETSHFPGAPEMTGATARKTNLTSMGGRPRLSRCVLRPAAVADERPGVEPSHMAADGAAAVPRAGALSISRAALRVHCHLALAMAALIFCTAEDPRLIDAGSDVGFKEQLSGAGVSSLADDLLWAQGTEPQRRSLLYVAPGTVVRPARNSNS